MSAEEWRNLPIQRWEGGRLQPSMDSLALEEPLELLVRRNGVTEPVSITMRSPGDDAALAVGFLHGEGVVRQRQHVVDIEVDSGKVIVGLSDSCSFDIDQLKRHFYATSSCGVCGRASIEAITANEPPEIDRDVPEVSSDMLGSLADRLKSVQETFEKTGGLHAAALFHSDGSLHLVCEDVGRHNAVDKVVGHLFLDDELPASSSILLLSGRLAFELVQKAAMAGIPVVAGIGAASSLAVELARQRGMTLVGFLSEQRFNVYSGAWRLSS